MNKNKIMKAMPTVLFISGIAGIFVSEIMVARDTLKAERVLNKKFELLEGSTIDDAGDVIVIDKPKYYTEVVKTTWKCYIPTFVSTTLTCAALIASNRLTAKQVALLSSAVAGAGSLVTKYRDKIREHVSPEVLREIDKEVAADEITKANPPVINTCGLLSSEHIDLSDDSECVFFDPFTKLKFRSTKLAVLGAKYFLNRNFSLGGSVGLEDFYAFLGIALPEEYRDCGWDCETFADDGFYWIDIDIVRSDEPDPETGEQYYILEYCVFPGEELEDNYYPLGNPVETEGSHVNA